MAGLAEMAGLAGAGGFVCASPLYAGCEKGSGAAEDPYRIYNIYHLQAMSGGLPDGMLPALALMFPATGESALRAGAATLFGEAEARATAHYRLMNDIDATPTWQANWNEGLGFLPIGDSASPFQGTFDGAGYAVRGLQMRRAGEMAGLLGVVGAGGRILNLGVDGEKFEGGAMVGLLAARVEAGGVIEGAWGRGRVQGLDNVGGLVGYLADGATMRRSWFGGHVRGRRNVGGLVGGAEARSESADTIADSWAMAQTHGFAGVGGLAGNWESGNRMTASWAGGPLTGTGSGDRFGCLASGLGESSASYSGVETSGCSAAGVGGTAVDSLQTLVAPEWSSAVWDFGSDSDFPALRNMATSDARGRSLQAGGIIFGLTRLLRGDGTVFPSLPLDLTTSVSGEEQSMLRLDVNGLAVDDGSATARLSSCRISGGAISAASNYNGARVSMLLLSSFGARLSLYDEDLCVVGIDSGAGGLATLRLSYAGAGSGPEDVLHFDYAAQLSPDLSSPLPPPPPLSFGFADAPTGFYPVMVFSGATARESVLTVTVMNGSLVSFAGGGFASGGGSEAALSLTESAVDLFTIDGLELSLTLEARGGEGQSAMVTVRFVSSARPFGASELSVVALGLSEATMGAEIVAAGSSGLSIWHHKGDESYALRQAGSLFGVNAEGRVTAALSLSADTHHLTLQLTGGGATAELSLRVEVSAPSLAIVSPSLSIASLSELSSGPVTVLWDAEEGARALTVTLRGGTKARFASSSAGGLTATGGGTEATVSLTADAIAVFVTDGLELELALTASDAAGQSATVTTRFVSSARSFGGTELSLVMLPLSSATLGAEIVAAGDSGLSIWHNNDDDERYALEQTGTRFGVNAETGRVTLSEGLSADIYDLTLQLTDGEATAELTLRLEVRAPALSIASSAELSSVTVTVLWDAEAGSSALTVTLLGGKNAAFASSSAGGLTATGGGTEATVSLTADAIAVFVTDGLELELALTASDAAGQSATVTTRFVSSARSFGGTELSLVMLPLSSATLGAEIVAAGDSGLSIWHNNDDDERYALEQTGTRFGVNAETGRVTLSEGLSADIYDLTLQLTDGEATAELTLRLEVRAPALSIASSAELSSVTVTVLWDAEAGSSALTVTLLGGKNAAFASSSAGGLTATGGGTEATVSLTADAIAVFVTDGLELELALTASDAAGQSATVTTRFVSSARPFGGTELSAVMLPLSSATLGAEIVAAGVSGLSIWHNDDGNESYALEQTGTRFGVNAETGRVTLSEGLSADIYDLTLQLTDGEATAELTLRLEVTPPSLSIASSEELSSVTVTVLWDAEAGSSALTVTLLGGRNAAFASSSAGGLTATGGGLEATVSLSSDAIDLFITDGLELELALTALGDGNETATVTTRFVSSARSFGGSELSAVMLPVSEATLGAEIVAAGVSGLSIWHNDDGNESYALEQTGTRFGVNAETGRVTLSEGLSADIYDLTLQLTDGEATAELTLRLEVTPPSLSIASSEELSSVTVTVLWDAEAGSSALTVTLLGGRNAAFASSSAGGLTATGGGSEATVSLSSDAIGLFITDGLELELALTAQGEGNETATVTTRFVSSARPFGGTELSAVMLPLSEATLGAEIVAAGDSGLSIWHNNDEDERYALEQTGTRFGVNAETGRVTLSEGLSADIYDLTLQLTGGEATAELTLRLEVTPPSLSIASSEELSSVTVTVLWDAEAGSSALTVTLLGGKNAAFASSSAGGLTATGGGSEATVSLSSDAIGLFITDGLELELALTAQGEGNETATVTTRFVSSARPFGGSELSAVMLPLSEATLGAEIVAAGVSGLSIWHNDDEDERYALEQTGTRFGVNAETGRVTLSEGLSADIYDLTLQLTDGEATAELTLRLEVTPPSLSIASSEELSSGTVTVLWDAERGSSALTVTLLGGSNAAFAAASSGGLTAAGGGSEATVSLSSDAIELFTTDGLELELALTALGEGDETATVTTRFVSSARPFGGSELSAVMLPLSEATLGAEIVAAEVSGLSIWHNDDGNESYALEQTGTRFGVNAETGRVTLSEGLSADIYHVTLQLTDGEATAELTLRLEVTPPSLSIASSEELSSGTVTVLWDAERGSSALTVTLLGGSNAAFAAASSGGLTAAGGGSEATVSLSSDAIELFTTDGLELELALTALGEGDETATVTTRFVSSARPFGGSELSAVMLPLSEATLGAEIVAAEVSGLSIWHNDDGNESYALEQTGTRFGVNAETGRVTLSEGLSADIYHVTLQLTDGEATAELTLRLEVTPPSLSIASSEELSSGTVTVLWDAERGSSALTVTLLGGSNAAFAAASSGGLTAAGGGSEATVSLSSDAIELFTTDGLELELALTALGEGDETATVTTRFVSSARPFGGSELSAVMLPLSEATLGAEIVAAEVSGLSIWHNDDGNESYALEQTGTRFGVNAETGRVTLSEGLSADIYHVTLQLTDGEATAELTLRLEVTPPSLSIASSEELSSGTVTVLWDAERGSSALTVTLLGGSNAAFAAASSGGLTAAGGGSEATVSLSSDAIELFTTDGLELELALTALGEGDETATVTTRFVSSARPFGGSELSAVMLPLSEATLGAEIVAAEVSGLSIWHNDDGNESYALEQTGTRFGVNAETGRVTLSEGLSADIYHVTLQLTDGEATAELTLRLEVTPPALSIASSEELSSGTVTVLWDAERGSSALTVTLLGGSNAAFAAASSGGLTAAGGGSEATVSLSSDAIELFTTDGLELELALTALGEGDETATVTTRFVSSARPFNGAGLRRAFLSDLEPGDEVFGAAEASLTIWHSANESEAYTLEGANAGLFTVGMDGAVTALERLLAASEKNYELTLILSGGGTVSRRDLRVELRPPFLGAADAVTVAADAAAGAAVFTLSLARQAGASFDAVAANGFRTEGGIEATVFLSLAATALFTADNLALSLTLTARDDLRAETATVRFVSAARAISKGRASLTITRARIGQTILAAGAAEISIWHNDDDGERYTLLQSASDFGVDATTGLVTAAVDLTIDIYDITLRLRDESLALTASQVLRLIDPSRWALLRFLEQIEAGEIAWTDADWDGDGIENPYDWMPTVYSGATVNLTLFGADPWPIYNVWQLQAIDGVSVSAGGTVSEDFGFFGDSESVRLGARYRLSLDIDAAPTREWGTLGFRPIGDGSSAFTGLLDGNGRLIRGLWMRGENGENNVGLFARVDAGATVRRLGMPDADIRARGGNVGAVVGRAGDGLLSLVWATGRVAGLADNVGGLAGSTSGEIKEAWFVGEVEGSYSVGGVLGILSNQSKLTNIWAVGQVSDVVPPPSFLLGGLIGNGDAGGRIRNGWSGVALRGASPDLKDVLFGCGSRDRCAGITVGNILLDRSLAARNPPFIRPRSSGVETVVNFQANWGNDNDFNFGASTDYPFLRRSEALWPGRQAFAFADYQTRLVRNGVIVTPSGLVILSANGRARFRLDTNGRATDEQTSVPVASCKNDNEGVTARANYNGVSVLFRASGGTVMTAPSESGCRLMVDLASEPDFASNGEVSLFMTIAVGRLSLSRSYSFGGALSGFPGILLTPPDAKAGAAIHTVTVRAGAALESFDDGRISSEGGSTATLLLRMDATAVFSIDNASVDLTLRAPGRGSGDETRALRVMSDIRLIGGGTLTAGLRDGATYKNAVLLSPQRAGLSIWHNGDNGGEPEEYGLIQPSSNGEPLFLVDAASGEIRGNPAASEDMLTEGRYDMTVHRSSSSPRALTVSRAFRLIVGPEVDELPPAIVVKPPELLSDPLMIESIVLRGGGRVLRLFDPARRALLRFLEQIEAGEIAWTDADWDGDGIENPYDWTPTVSSGVTVNLTLGGADGSAANPWPIYNIWQLQAIASVSVSIDGAAMTTGFRLFGDGDNMTAHYRLMNDIDATPTRVWTNGDNAGFVPIPVFRGVLNGDGKVVRGLFIDSGESNVGLFGELGGGADAARIVSLGLLDARIESRARGVGGFVELMRFKSSIVDSWISGFVRSPSGHNGGLIGENDSSCNVCSVVGGWFAGELETAGSPRIGGIVGRQEAAAGKSDFRGLWSLGEIRTSENSVTGELHTGGGLIGEITGAQNPASGYWSIETSGVSSSAGGE